jgi:hypothetical protein
LIRGSFLGVMDPVARSIRAPGTILDIYISTVIV